MDKDMNRRRAFWLGLLGCLAAGAGIYVTAIVFAIGSMPHRHLSGRAFWQALLGDLVLSPAVVPAVFGVGLVMMGLLTATAFLPISFGWLKRLPSATFRIGLVAAAVLICLGGLIVYLVS